MPVVCAQSLRGRHASVATEAGATSHVVASALGHNSPAVTHAHYIDGATARRARTRRVIGAVAPDPRCAWVAEAPSPAPIAGTRTPRKPIRRASPKATANPALHVVPSNAANAAATPAETHWFAAGVGERVTPDELPEAETDGRKDIRPFRRGDAKGRKDWCEWSDSNRHGVTHWYLNPAKS